MTTVSTVDMTQGSSHANPIRMSMGQTKQMPSVEGVKQPTQSEAPQPEKVEEPLSSKFAILARKEKAIRSQYLRKEQELKVREDRIKADEAKYQSDYVPKSKLAEILSTDPTSLGLNWDQVTQAILNQKPEDASLRQLRAEMEALKTQTAQIPTQLENQQKQAYEQAVKQITTEAKILIDSDPTFETIKETNSQDAVVELIKQQFDADGTLMSVEEAAKEVEDYLLEQAMKLAQLKKVKERMQPPQLPQVAPTAQKQAIKTLTNQVMATTTRGLSNSERRQRAIAAFKGQLTN